MLPVPKSRSGEEGVGTAALGEGWTCPLARSCVRPSWLVSPPEGRARPPLPPGTVCLSQPALHTAEFASSPSLLALVRLPGVSLGSPAFCAKQSVCSGFYF